MLTADCVIARRSAAEANEPYRATATKVRMNRRLLTGCLAGRVEDPDGRKFIKIFAMMDHKF
jgi:hypothetical protein